MFIRECNICGEKEGIFLINSNGYDIVKCSKCDLIFVNQTFTETELQKIYSKGYYTGDFEKTYQNYFGESKKRIAGNKNKVLSLSKYINSGKLLEIGCAAGYFLEAAKEKFEVEGIEFSEYSSKYAREKYGHNVHTGSIFSANYPSQNYDVIVMYDVIEHLTNPHKTLIEIHRILRQKGILVLSTGNVDSIMASKDLSKWGLMAPPWHLYYFSKKTLSKLLHVVGFKILNISSNSHFTDSKNKFINNKYIHYIIKYFCLGDIMTFYCIKK